MASASTLQRRLVGTTFALILSVCAIFCVGIFAAFESAEDKLFDVHREREIAGMVAYFEHDPTLLAVPQQNFTVYAIKDGDTSTLPTYLRGLTAADDELVLNGHEYHVQLETRGRETYYFLLDEDDFETFESLLLGSMMALVGVVIVCSGLLSVMLARRISRPLTELAREVAGLDGEASSPVAIRAVAAADAEVAVLAGAIEGYHQRFSEMLHREREFSADVSHELRTPLTSIQGAAELLERKLAARDADDEFSELTARIRRGCLHMTTLIEALLYLARDPASFSSMIEPVSIDRVVERQIAAVRDVADSRGIAIDIHRDGPSNTVQTIPAVINIVLGNILKNAVKYTDHDRITVYVNAQEVIIQDYGPGIDAEIQATLFDRYNRGQNTSPDGTGIGLALVRRFCDQYGWTIDFHSEEYHGTRVAVAF